MGLFSGSTTTKPKMLPWQKDLNKDLFGKAENLLGNGKGGTAYTGSMVTPFHPSSMGAFGYDAKGNLTGGGMMGLAAANSGDKGMAPQLQQIMSNGGFSNDQLDTMSAMKETSNAPWLKDFINGDGLTADQRSVADFYRDDMNADFDLASNPAFASVRDRALKEQQMALGANAAKQGRYGGGSSQTILAREQGNLASDLDMAEYDKWRARQAAGAGGLAGISQAGVDNRSNATTLKSGIDAQLFNAQNAGLDRMGQAYQTALAPLQTERAVGAEFEDLMSRQLADQKRIHDEKDPLARLQKFMNFSSGQPTGSTQTATPSVAQLLGAGGLAALTLPSMFKFGAPAAGGTVA